MEASTAADVPHRHRQPPAATPGLDTLGVQPVADGLKSRASPAHGSDAVAHVSLTGLVSEGLPALTLPGGCAHPVAGGPELHRDHGLVVLSDGSHHLTEQN